MEENTETEINEILIMVNETVKVFEDISNEIDNIVIETDTNNDENAQVEEAKLCIETVNDEPETIIAQTETQELTIDCAQNEIVNGELPEKPVLPTEEPGKITKTPTKKKTSIWYKMRSMFL